MLRKYFDFDSFLIIADKYGNKDSWNSYRTHQGELVIENVTQGYNVLIWDLGARSKYFVVEYSSWYYEPGRIMRAEWVWNGLDGRWESKNNGLLIYEPNKFMNALSEILQNMIELAEEDPELYLLQTSEPEVKPYSDEHLLFSLGDEKLYIDGKFSSSWLGL